MNLRLLIIFGLVLQLFAVHSTTRCASGADEPVAIAQAEIDCAGCCDQTPSDEPEPTSPCEACPICTEFTTKPNRLAVMQGEASHRPFEEQVAPERWSVIVERDASVMTRTPRRSDTPSPVSSVHALPRLCRWLT